MQARDGDARGRAFSSIRGALLTAGDAPAVMPMTGRPRPVFGRGSVRARLPLQNRCDGGTQTDVIVRKEKRPLAFAGGRNERFWIFGKYHGLLSAAKPKGRILYGGRA